LAFYYIAYGLGHFLSENVVMKQGPKKALAISSLLSLLYVASYIIPVSCTNNTAGICAKGFTGTLISIMAFIGGLGLAVF